MRSKLARGLLAASLLALATAPVLGVTSSDTGRGWLGVTTQPTDSDLRKSLRLKQDGLLVNQVTRDSPADRAGLRRGDVILTYNSRNVVTPEQLRDQVRDTEPGRTVSLGISRDGHGKNLELKVGDVSDSGDFDDEDAPTPPPPPAAPRAPRSYTFHDDGHTHRFFIDGREIPEDQMDDHLKDLKIKLKGMDDLPFVHTHVYTPMAPRNPRGRLGVRVETLSDDLAQALGVDSGKGALVMEVIEDTPAQRAGIRAGDVIVRVGSEPVEDQDDLVRALSTRSGKVNIDLIRKGDPRTVEAELDSGRSSGDDNWIRIPEPAPRSRGFRWRTGDSSDDDAALRREIEDLRKELQELREEMRDKK